ncbi:MAG TPA: hypothetical protein VFU69_12695 [Ktedonobacterales bacterium]|nr:hypothetical protein [Ktedonobacterales bacterium]
MRTARDVDLERVLAGLNSPDESIRAQAVRSLCPCRVGYAIYECYAGEVKRFQKDPSELVRKAALHVEEDAFRLEQKIYSPQAEDDWQEDDPYERSGRGHDKRTHKDAAAPAPAAS